MKMLKNWKKDKEKGFTLVELIVVLVILAILAAILVPALLGWIDKAREKQYVLDARSVYMAAQSIATEKYAKANSGSGMCTISKEEGAEILKIADVEDKIVKDSNGVPAIAIEWAGTTGRDAYTIIGMFMTFTEGNTTCMLMDGTWTVSPDIAYNNFANEKNVTVVGGIEMPSSKPSS